MAASFGRADQLVKKWYALKTRSRFENIVCDMLTKKSLEAFLPKIRVPSRRRDRKITLLSPMFPGYLFVKTDLNPYEHLEIVKTTGAVMLVGNPRGPQPIHEDEINSLKIMTASSMPVATGTRYKKGEWVMVIRGPFAGVIGTFTRYKGKGKVVVYIEALGRFAAVEVDEKDIERALDPKRHKSVSA